MNHTSEQGQAKTSSTPYSVDGFQENFTSPRIQNGDSLRNLFSSNNDNSNNSNLHKRQFPPLSEPSEDMNAIENSNDTGYGRNKTSPSTVIEDSAKRSANTNDSFPLHQVSTARTSPAFSYNYISNSESSFCKLPTSNMDTTNNKVGDTYNNDINSTTSISSNGSNITDAGNSNNSGINGNTSDINSLSTCNASDIADHAGFNAGNIYTPHPYHHHQYPQHPYPASVLSHHHHHFYHSNGGNSVGTPTALANSFYHHHHHHHQPHQQHQQQQQQQQQPHASQLQPFYNISKHTNHFDAANVYSSYMDGLQQYHPQESLPTYLSAFGPTSSALQHPYPVTGGGGVSLGCHSGAGGVASAVGGVGTGGGSGSAFNVVHSQYSVGSSSIGSQSHGIQQSTG